MATYNVTDGKDSGVGSLRSAVELANMNPGADDIYIQTDVQLNSAIEISDSVYIGNPFGATITQTQDDRIFKIDDGNSQQKSEISLYRLSLTGGNAELGGAIISQENLTITDSSFYNNSAEVKGAAIYVSGANLKVERSKFEDNRITSIEEDPEKLSPNEVLERDLYVSGGELEIIIPFLNTAQTSVVENAPAADAQVGNDSPFSGGEGNDILTGEAGDDTLDGAAGNDTLFGSDGNDYLLGSTGDDILYGEGGNDTLSGDGGNNFVTGGDGSDLFNLVIEGKSIIADFELGTDKLQLSQIAYGDLDITGDTSSMLNYQGAQIGMVNGISPADLTQDSFLSV